MEWRIVAFRTGSLVPFLAGMWVRVAHSININSPGHNLATAQEYGENTGTKGKREGENKRGQEEKLQIQSTSINFSFSLPIISSDACSHSPFPFSPSVLSFYVAR